MSTFIPVVTDVRINPSRNQVMVTVDQPIDVMPGGTVEINDYVSVHNHVVVAVAGNALLLSNPSNRTVSLGSEVSIAK